eukprot:3432234-Ditylum_brightwellii.AAC.1
MAERNLFKLLDFNPAYYEDRQMVDADAIIKEARQNSLYVDLMYSFSYSPYKRCCPLHQAIQLCLDVGVIDALISLVAIKQKRNGETALHLACEYRASLDVISLLLSSWPDAVKEKNSQEDIPLHVACTHGASLDMISLLLSSWPDGAKEKTSLSQTPLFVACNYKAPYDVVSFLLRSWPDATKEINDYGWTPLHLACCYDASFNVVSLLLSTWPDAAREKDNAGCTPLHSACRSETSLDVVQLLLDQWLKAAENRNSYSVDSLADYNTPMEISNLLFH